MRKILLSVMLVTTALFVAGCAQADAGKSQVVHSGDTVTLDGSKSSGASNEKLTYEWKQIKGVRVEMLNANSAIATFIAPQVDKKNVLLFRLRVKAVSERGSSISDDYVSIIVEPAEQPPADTTPPTITLNGDANITLSVGDTYTEAGATATDDRDGDVNVTISGTVDTATPGICTVTYTATDKAGNSATATRTVTVIDNTATGISLSGHITDLNGAPISNAIVTVLSQNITTDANGSYEFNNIQESNHTIVNVYHPNYLSNSRIASVSDRNVTLDIKMGAPKATLTFNSTEGATVSHDGASVELPANGYIDANGSTYTGQIIVKMSYYPISTQYGRAAFPGTFEGIEGNTTFPIQSYGFMNVELTDPEGNILNLDGNKTATLVFPSDPVLDSPSIIPLWYYDTQKGYWIKEGQATNSENYYEYVGTVSHFTSWNLDAKGPVATFQGCVEDENGTRVSNASTLFRTSNWDSYTLPTDDDGSISVHNLLANTTITFVAYKKIDDIQYAGTTSFYISEGENKILNQCVVIKPDPDFIIPIPIGGDIGP